MSFTAKQIELNFINYSSELENIKKRYTSINSEERIEALQEKYGVRHRYDDDYGDITFKKLEVIFKDEGIVIDVNKKIGGGYQKLSNPPTYTIRCKVSNFSGEIRFYTYKEGIAMSFMKGDRISLFGKAIAEARGYGSCSKDNSFNPNSTIIHLIHENWHFESHIFHQFNLGYYL